MTVAELKKIWEPAAQGKVMNWNQVRSGFPDKRLVLFGAGADSGTFDYFTEAVNGKAKQSRSDYTGSEDDNVLVQGVSRNEGALGYFGLAYYEANKGRLKSVKIVNPKTNQAVAPSTANVKNGSYQPLSRPIFIYVNAKSAEKPEVRAFVEYYMKNAPTAVGAVGYVPLTAADYNKALARFTNKQVGTVFGGKEEIGVQIGDILGRTPR
jgi:phosphate transport system substrate-binding protein